MWLPKTRTGWSKTCSSVSTGLLKLADWFRVPIVRVGYVTGFGDTGMDFFTPFVLPRHADEGYVRNRHGTVLLLCQMISGHQWPVLRVLEVASGKSVHRTDDTSSNDVESVDGSYVISADNADRHVSIW